MRVAVCEQCGATIDETASSCPVCGALFSTEPVAAPTTPDPRTERVRTLLAQARLAHEQGDLAAALRYGHEALAEQPDCSTTHALLGHVCEESGDNAAARAHFQAALRVGESAPEAQLFAPALVEMLPVRPVQTKWITPVLIGCVLFSALGVLFTFLPAARRGQQAIVVKLNAAGKAKPDTRPLVPRWAEHVPTPVRPANTTVQPSDTTPAVSDVEHSTVKNSQPPVAAVQEDAPMTVLGSSARTAIPVDPTTPTLEQAEQAYFKGEFERAITIYESLLTTESEPEPRLSQNLGWCYHRLGNAKKATEHLQRAANGYRALLTTNPDNVTAYQALQSCEATLRTLNAPAK